jgi:hypothetical protein
MPVSDFARLAQWKAAKLKLCAILMLALVGTIPGARACTDSSAMRHYFFDYRPDARAGRDVLVVRIVAIDGDVVRARLDERFAEALGIDLVTIDLLEYPLGANCIGYGLMGGPAFVVVDRLTRLKSGEVRIAAVAVGGQFNTRPRRSQAELDSYIVDSTLKEAAAAGRKHQ